MSHVHNQLPVLVAYLEWLLHASNVAKIPNPQKNCLAKRKALGNVARADTKDEMIEIAFLLQSIFDILSGAMVNGSGTDGC